MYLIQCYSWWKSQIWLSSWYMGDVYQHLHCFIHPRYCISFFKITDLHVEKLAGKVNHGRASDTNITRGCLVYTCKKYRASAKKLQELDDSHSRKMCICINTCIQYLYIYIQYIHIYTYTAQPPNFPHHNFESPPGALGQRRHPPPVSGCQSRPPFQTSQLWAKKS